MSQDEEDHGAEPYTLEHLSAVVRPVILTMSLAAFAVANIRDPDPAASSESIYLVYSSKPTPGGGGGGGGSSGAGDSGQAAGQAAVNALVIVCVICAATFGLVLCYYYRCLRLMTGYLMLSSATLLGYNGSLMLITALRLIGLPWDFPSFVFIMWNFAAVGVVAVFWQVGVPRFITQGYLVCVSVILAWVLSKLPSWTVWALLVALALYDLCAVLTPCGPLKALVALSQERRDPIPGLLYEATIDSRRGSSTSTSGPSALPEAHTPATPPQSINLLAYFGGRGGSGAALATQREEGGGVVFSSPLHRQRSSSNAPLASASSAAGESKEPIAVEEKVEEEASLPGDDEEERSRRLAVHLQERELRREAEWAAEERGEGEEEDKSIKLGLGDFVFYSVLVSQAALFDSASLAACFITVLLGLAGTLALLSVFKMALPALPISIFAGLIVYLLTRFSISPLVLELALVY
jgi:presenilin 1